MDLVGVAVAIRSGGGGKSPVVAVAREDAGDDLDESDDAQ